MADPPTVDPLEIEALGERLERWRRASGWVLAPSVAGLVLALGPGELSPQAHRLAAVATLTVILWVTEAMPLGASAMMAPALAVLLGVAPAKQAFAPLAHPLIFLFLGGFLMAEGLAVQGVDRRAAMWLMARRFVDGRPARAATAIAIVAFVFSMWISNTATTAIMIPIAMGFHQTMARLLPDDPQTRRRLARFSGGMVLLVAYAASAGGVATPIGTGPNVIALGFLAEERGVRYDFFQWMSFALPTALAFLVLLLVLSARLFPAPVARIEGLTDQVERELRELGPARPGERRAIAVFGLAVLGWIAPAALRMALGSTHPVAVWARGHLHEGVVAVLCACLLFAVRDGGGERRPLLPWSRVAHVDWGTLLLLGGGISLGALTFETGLAHALGRWTLDAAGPLASSSFGLLAVATGLVIVLTEVTSNTATTTMMLPVLIGIAEAGGIDPIPTTISVTLAASFAFMLPVSTPPNAIAYGTGLVPLPTMMRAGLRLDILGYLLLLIVGAFLLPALL